MATLPLERALKIALLLETLQNQLVALRTQASPLMQHATLKPRFDRQLFHTRSTLMKDYLDEAQTNLDELRQSVNDGKHEQVAGLRSISPVRSPPCTGRSQRPLRTWDSASPGLGKWQRKRLEHRSLTPSV